MIWSVYEALKPNNKMLSILETRAAYTVELVNDCYVDEVIHHRLLWCQVASCLMESLSTSNQ